MKTKNYRPLLLLICMSLLCFVHAESNEYDTDRNESKNSTYKSDSDQDTYKRTSYSQITPSAGPRVAHGADVLITADFILWKAYQEGLNYATNGYNVTNSADSNDLFADIQHGKSAFIGNSLAPGFKVGLGLNLCHDGWDIKGEYTWLYASESRHISENDATNSALLGFISGKTANSSNEYNNLFVKGNRISSDWSLKFNVLDLELGRNFFLSQFLTMRPFIGLKMTWQDQNWDTTCHNTYFQITDTASATTNITGPLKSHQDTYVYGVGIRGGFDCAWYFAKSWSIIGDMGLTSMWVNYNTIHRKDTVEDLTRQSKKVIVHAHGGDQYAVKYIGEFELGLRWETWFYDDNYHFSVQAGWEEQVWINWGRFLRLFDNSNNDLSFQGLNLKLRLDF